MTLTAMDLVATAKQNITEITTNDAQTALDDYLLLDVREPAEFTAGHLPGAINIPRGVLEFKIGAQPEFSNLTNAAIIVYCQTGGRSALATEALNKLGYSNAVSLAGGYKEWTEKGYAVA